MRSLARGLPHEKSPEKVRSTDAVHVEVFVEGPELLREVRAACVAAWRMRSNHNIFFGVRDWSQLRFKAEYLPETRRTIVTIIGACEDSSLRFYVWQKLGCRSRLDVICREEG